MSTPTKGDTKESPFRVQLEETLKRASEERVSGMQRIASEGGLFTNCTLRDWLAGRETCPTSDEIGLPCAEALAGPHPSGDPETNPIAWMQWDCEWRAKLRYMRADAVIKARGGAL